MAAAKENNNNPSANTVYTVGNDCVYVESE